MLGFRGRCARVLSGTLVCLLAFPLCSPVFPQNAPPPSSPPPQTEPEKPQPPPEQAQEPLPPDEDQEPATGVVVAGATLKGRITGPDRSTPLAGARVHAVGKDGRVVTSAPADSK